MKKDLQDIEIAIDGDDNIRAWHQSEREQTNEGETQTLRITPSVESMYRMSVEICGGEFELILFDEDTEEYSSSTFKRNVSGFNDLIVEVKSEIDKIENSLLDDLRSGKKYYKSNYNNTEEHKMLDWFIEKYNDIKDSDDGAIVTDKIQSLYRVPRNVTIYYLDGLLLSRTKKEKKKKCSQ